MASSSFGGQLELLSTFVAPWFLGLLSAKFPPPQTPVWNFVRGYVDDVRRASVPSVLNHDGNVLQRSHSPNAGQIVRPKQGKELRAEGMRLRDIYYSQS